MKLLHHVPHLALVCLVFTLQMVPSLAETPQQTVQTLQVPEGMEIELFAAEPMITNPAAIDIDTQGRVWVAEIQWYRRAAKDPPADKIKVLEDTDGDGRADKVTVFAEGIFCPMSICVAGDKVYVATSPDLWVYEDKNGDLKADGPPKKLLTGFGGYNHDHGAHSLILGPDHKWWMAHGDRGFDVTGTDGSHIKFQWGAMLRGELDGGKLEIIAQNFRNPYEIAVSSFGESYCSDNDNDGNFSVRICWILDGGDYGWFGSPPFRKEELDARVPPGTPFRESWHFRAYQPGYVPATLVTGFGSPTGMCYYEGDAFGPKYKNAPLHTDAGPREVRIYRHENDGYGKQARSQNLVTTSGDNYFRPDDICTAPDGTLYIADWYDGGVGGHAYNDPNRGRIYRLVPKDRSKIKRIGKPGPYNTLEGAVISLQSPNLATQYLAREYLLAHPQESVTALKKLADDGEPNFAARALWVLDRIGGEARQSVIARLSNSDAQMRELAVRILRRHGRQYESQILALAQDDSPAVRREVLLAIRNFDSPQALDALAKAAAAYDGQDRYQLETIYSAAKGREDVLFARLKDDWSLKQLPLMQLLNAPEAAKYLMAHLRNKGLDEETGRALLDAAGNIESIQAGQAMLNLLSREDVSSDFRRLALLRLSTNLNGSWKTLREDKTFLDSIRKLLDSELNTDALRVITDNNLRMFGPEVFGIAENAKQPLELRKAAIGTLVSLRRQDVGKQLKELLSDSLPPIRRAAVDALVDVQEIKTLRQVLGGDKRFPPDLRQAAVSRLMSSTGGALVLLRMIDAGELPATQKQAAIALATEHPDSNIRVLYDRFIPEDKRPKRLGMAIKPAEILALKGDGSRGEKIFFQSSAAQCKNCHRVGETGGALGPDLSQIGRKYERATLLETILDPSKALAPEYYVYLLETDFGQVYAGFLVGRNEQEVVLRDAKDQLIRVPAEEVVTLEKQPKSLMPELVLRDVTAQDAADLLAYLATLKSAVQHVDRFRVLGPFDAGGEQSIDRKFPPEENLADVDLAARYKGLGGKPVVWNEVVAQRVGDVLAVDQVRYDRQLGLRGERVTHYYLVHADSAADQEVTLLLGSDDSNKVWVNGKQVHRFRGSRAVGYAQDKVNVPLRSGRNTIVIKVENGSGPGGVALSISSPSAVQVRTH